jgi:F-type H+-transporting ATPase subunit delta
MPACRHPPAEVSMKGGEAAARRYARALLDVALEKGDDALREQLETLGQLYTGHAELRTLLLHPTVPPEKKTAVIAALLRGRPSDLLQRLVALLLQRDRIELLPLIAKAYVRRWNTQKGIVEAEAVSARALDETEARAIAAAAARAVGGKEVELRRRVDPDLMGGLLLRMEGRIFDGSVRARLRALREQLAGTRT